MATLTKVLLRASALTCVSALFAGQAMASAQDEFTLQPQIIQQDVVEQPYVAPVTDVYIQPAPAQELSLIHISEPTRPY